MVERILRHTGIIFIGMIRDSIIAAVTASAVSLALIPDIEVVGLALFTIVYLLPAMFLYNLGCALKLKQLTCDILYFAGFLSSELFFCVILILALARPYSEGGEGFIVFFLYILAFIGIAVYLVETIFRTRRKIKELGHKEIPEKFDRGNISKHLQTILIGIVRSYIIATLVVLVVTMGSGFIDSRFELTLIKKGLLYLTYLPSAIVIYHIAYGLKLKWWKCDVLYFITFIIVEKFLWSAFRNEPYPIAIIAVGCAIVYIVEVYFRNWVVLKNMQTDAESKTGEVYSYYPAKKSLLDLGKLAIGIGIFAIFVGLVFGLIFSFVKYRERQKQNQMRAFVCKIIDSARNQTEFYRNNSEEQAIEKLNNSIGRMSGNFEVSVENHGYSDCQIVFENGTVFFADVRHENGKFILRRLMSTPFSELQEKFLKVLGVSIADVNKPENKNKGE